MATTLDEKYIVEVKDLYFSRGQAPREKMIFNGLNLRIPRGKITAIMGPSGTGKTTLLRLMGGQLQPDAGSIDVCGQRVADLSRKKLYQLRRRMGVLFQQGGLFTDYDVFENVAFPLYQHTQLPKDMVRDLVLLSLEAVGLRGAARLKINELSGGMQRRVALARTTVLGPELMMYDEPFSGQDPITMGVLVQLIKQLNDALGLTTVIVTHDVPETAAIADYVYIISEGQVMGEGTPAELLGEASLNPAVDQFISGKADGPVAFRYPALDIVEELLC